MTPILGAAVLLAMGISPLPAADVSAITAQLATISSLDGKLTVLQNTATGLSDNDKAALGAALIQSVAPADQKEAARRVAQILATGSADTAIFAALLANDLPASLASSLAGSIVIGASQTDPVHLPQITAAVINANSATIANAPGIAGEVTAAAPLSRASAIASAIGISLAGNDTLTKEAPLIATSMTREIIAKGGDITQLGKQVSDTIAALTVLLPGSVASNQALIVEIGRDVAAVISDQYSSLAPAIVGVTASALRAAAGGVDVSSVINSFSATFGDAISDPTIKTQITSITTAVNQGTANIDTTAITNLLATAQSNQGGTQSPTGVSGLPGSQLPGSQLPGSQFVFPPPAATPTPTPTPGPVNNQVTPVTNQ
ncbi:MAG: hypothetical protein WCH57_02100 [Verrucomicrobiota bacterium]